jgi:hypothetical protein
MWPTGQWPPLCAGPTGQGILPPNSPVACASLRRQQSTAAAPVPSPQCLPLLLQGRAACVHATSDQLVLLRAELSPRPAVPAVAALAVTPPQCSDLGA